jgi:hypothetical protein
MAKRTAEFNSDPPATMMATEQFGCEPRRWINPFALVSLNIMLKMATVGSSDSIMRACIS